MTSPSPDPSEAGGGSPALGGIVLLLGIAAFAVVATMRVADPLLPQVAAEFDVTAGEAAIISSAFTIAYAVGQFVYGPLGDRYGKIRLIAWTTTISGITVAAAGLATSLPTLGLLRFIGGATAAAIVPLSMAFIGDHVAYEHRQTMLARMLSGTIVGVILGQIFGGLIGQYLGWRAAFPIVGAVFFLVGLLLLRELCRKDLPAPKLSSTISMNSLIRGYADLFHRPWARIVLLAVFVESFFFYGAFTFIGADIHQRFDLDFGAVGLILSFFGLGGIIYILTVRRLVTSLGEHGLAMSGGLLVMVGLLSLSAGHLSMIAVAQALLGLGLYMLHNTLQTNATQMAPEARGLAVSTFANSLFLGQAAGVYTGGILVDNAGFTIAYAAAAIGLACLGVTLSRLLRRRSRMN